MNWQKWPTRAHPEPGSFGEAGVSTGNAYYWFKNKDELVQAFYLSIQERHLEAARSALADGGKLTDRLRAVERALLDVLAPHHGFGTAFLTTALRPGALS